MTDAPETLTPELLPLGPNGVLVRFSDALSETANRAALAFRAQVAANQPDGLVELAGSLTSVLVRFDPAQQTRAGLEAYLRDQCAARDWASAPLPEGRKRWTLAARFGGADGPDLEAVAEQVGTTPKEAVEQICATSLRILALGFAPGQPYLGFLDDTWNIPRRTDVTPEVPPGAIVVAVRQVIPFANAAPTGWWQIGRTPFRCFDPDRTKPIVWNAGDEVRFEPVGAENPSANVDATGILACEDIT